MNYNLITVLCGFFGERPFRVINGIGDRYESERRSRGRRPFSGDNDSASCFQSGTSVLQLFAWTRPTLCFQGISWIDNPSPIDVANKNHRALPAGMLPAGFVFSGRAKYS